MKKNTEVKKEDLIEEKSEKIEKKGHKLLIAIIVVVIIALGGTYFLFFSKSQEEKLKDTLIELGSYFYENFYSQKIGKTDEERVAFLKKYEEIGIKINLDNLSRYNDEEHEEMNKVFEEKVKLFVNDSTNKECNKDNTKVTIYPQSPYDSKTYKIEA